MWEYEDSNKSNWANNARECYPIAVSIPELIYLVPLETSRFLSKHQGFYRNIKVYLETSRFLSKPTTSTLLLYINRNRLTSLVSIKIGECQSETTMSYSNHQTFFVPIEIGKCQLEMTMSYSNHLTSFVSIDIGNISPFLCLFSSRSLVFLLNISQLN